MANINITGTIQDASGSGVDDVVVRLSPSPLSAGAAEAMSGYGMVSDPVEVLTSGTGAFTVVAVQGFRYRLQIAAIGFDREFVAPSQSTISFDLLGLSPTVEAAPQSVTQDGVRETHLIIGCDSIAAVRQRYDRVILETSTSLSGTYSTLVTIFLHAGKKFYNFKHSPAPAGSYYRAHYVNGANSDVSSSSDIVATDDYGEESLLISIEELKEVYLFGIDLTKDDGEEFPRRMYEHYIRAASAWLSKELDISVVAKEFTDETQDHYGKDWGRWGYFQLWNYPLIKVNKVSFQYPSMSDEVIIDPRWVVPEDGGEHGVIQIVPGQGNIADVLLIPGSIMPMWSGRSGRVPGIWHFDYRAGFEPTSLPTDIKHIIAMWSSIGILNIAGDLVAGAGIATKTLTVPGLHQNIVTTASSTNSGFGARILEYQKEIKSLVPNLRRFYGKNTRMVVA